MLVSKIYRFEAAHILPRHPGKCSNMHGHSWQVEVEVSGDVDGHSGFVIDFYELGKWVQPLIDRFDHKVLNCFVRYPSSENLAIHIAHYLRAAMPYYWVNVIEDFTIRVSETEKCWAEFNMKRDRHMIEDADLAAGWASPDSVKGGTNIAVALSNVNAMLPEMERKYIEALTIQEQLKLYVETVNEPVLPFSEAQ